jgi:hypothetical protein
MGAEVARQIEELDGGEVGGGDALEDLLVGRVGRLARRSGRASASPRNSASRAKTLGGGGYALTKPWADILLPSKCRPESYLTAETQMRTIVSQTKNKRQSL